MTQAYEEVMEMKTLEVEEIEQPEVQNQWKVKLMIYLEI